MRKLYLYGRHFFEESDHSVVDDTLVTIYVETGTLAEFFRGLPGRKNILAEIAEIFEGLPRLNGPKVQVSSDQLFDRCLEADEARILGWRMVEILRGFGIGPDLHRRKVMGWMRTSGFTYEVARIEFDSDDTWELIVEI